MNNWFMVTYTQAVLESEISYPANTFLLVDETGETLNDGNFNPDWDEFGTQHRDGANMVHADGHAKRYPYASIKRWPRGPLFYWFEPIREEM
jgi:prepilin-type processing-associated H-X9-DG protein